MEKKEQLVQACKLLLEHRAQTIREAIQHAQSSANEDTKSSMGDKYETGRAMMQLEIEKNAQQLEQVKKMLGFISSLPIQPCATIVPGALAETNRGMFFFAVALGLVRVNQDNIMTVSLASPLGKAAQGLAPGNTFVVNQNEYIILSIC